MAPPRDDDWSDSDEEDIGEVESTVLLGVPDGPIDDASDINDVAVSRIGGHPAFLASSEPPLSSSQCKSCSQPMELLVQMWCPFENSPMDRALYMWGCPRAGCQGKASTVRAWRGLRYNQKYAAQLERKLARQRQREQEKAEALAEEERKKVSAKINPFSMKLGAPGPNPFGLGAQLFGDVSPSPAPVSPTSGVTADDLKSEDEGSQSDEGSDDDSGSEGSLITAMSTTVISESGWKSAPTYPPLYLSTLSEYVPPKAKFSLPPGTQIIDPSEVDEKSGKDTTWISESYENSLDIDQVFEKFSKRVEIEPEQVVRYDLKGTPLPFSSDETFKSLFPDPKQETLPVTKAAFTVVQPQKRVYDPSSVPPCPSCGAPRVFECQLMPNIINVLSTSDAPTDKNLTDEERRQAVEKALKKGDKDARGSMEWGTCMIFSCENDCCVDENKKECKESWKEEYVLIQWDV
ncbi:programmed cell death protein 2 [Ephemerocybe angulata]|uniref:Programmed cell death protein 2 n=1 Tax=Ephemerocybe angulata TaxID=980116 RepID=A0A8H6M5K1_9AGAR|nr:programmed cell death protein 2 [Tulosesus angulatus]